MSRNFGITSFKGGIERSRDGRSRYVERASSFSGPPSKAPNTPIAPWNPRALSSERCGSQWSLIFS